MHTIAKRHFQGQHENEQILRVIHRHWFGIATHLIIIMALSVVLIGSLLSLPVLFANFISPQSWQAFLFIESTLFVFLWLYGFLVWIDYYFDVWIVTNERIVNIEQKGLFTRRISELRFNRVQDVTGSVNGLIPTMLNFGDVFVQTAGEEQRFVFRQVPDPFAIKDAVMKLSRSSLNEDMNRMAQAFQDSARPSPTA